MMFFDRRRNENEVDCKRKLESVWRDVKLNYSSRCKVFLLLSRNLMLSMHLLIKFMCGKSYDVPSYDKP